MGLLLAGFCWGENALADQLKIVTDLEQYLRSTHHDLLHDDGIYVVSKSSQSPTEAHGTDLESRYTRTEAPFRAGLFYCCNGVGSMIGGIRETQEMLNFCAEHGIGAEIEVIPAEKINEAYERVLASDVRYRFVIDTATI